MDHQCVISVQSSVAYGYVGNSAAMVVLQYFGIEVWPLNTTYLSNHKGYQSYYGRDTDINLLNCHFQGLVDRGVTESTGAVLSGYLANEAIGRWFLEHVNNFKRPGCLYLCDPVMGDKGSGLYVEPALASLIKNDLLAQADLLTPNHFELEWLTGMTIETMNDLQKAIEHLLKMGPHMVLAKSIMIKNREGELLTLLADRQMALAIVTPKIDAGFAGTGDSCAALFLAHLMAKMEQGNLLNYTVNTLYELVEKSTALNRKELALTKLHKQLRHPKLRFYAKPLNWW